MELICKYLVFRNSIAVNKNGNCNMGKAWCFMSKYDYDLDLETENSLSLIVKHLRKNAEVLEFGPATGRLTKYMAQELHCAVDIVELDPEGYGKALQYARDGVLGDIEALEWEESFQGRVYDFIIFADVLEHLRNPQAIVKKVKKYLKQGGRLLFSVPNVAHNSVIYNLLCNEFQYNAVGLLDDTHIHFFAYHSIRRMIRECGYYIASEEATYIREVPGEFPNHLETAGLVQRYSLDGHKYGEVYQFVYSLSAGEIPEEESCLVPYAMQSRMAFYYRRKNGDFKETDTLCYYYNKREFACREIHVIFDGQNIIEKEEAGLKVHLPEDVEAFRLDPIENEPALAKAAVQDEQGKAVPFTTNGVCYLDGRVYRKDDLQILIGRNHHKEIKVSIECWFEDDIYDEVNLLAKENGRICEEKKNIVAENDRISEELHVVQEMNERLKEELHIVKETNEQLKEELHVAKEMNGQLMVENQHSQQMAHILAMEKEIILHSTSWKITKPYRAAAELLKKLGRVILPRRVRKALFILLHYGFKECFRNTKAYFARKDLQTDYVQKVIHTEEAELKKQRKTKFNKEILFSIIVPLYNTPIEYLTEMIQSCQEQTYGNWELCLADGSDNEHQEVGETVRRLARKDKRIQYKVLERNGGISENTNAALAMAKGDYIALLDHDDLLHPSAFYEYMHAICERGADFIYCDEMTFEGQLDHVITMHFKPDFAIDNLRANNYICHFSVFKKELLDKAGKFRPEYDGSQDHDMILRLTEQAEEIVHIPRILYFWRSHPQSVASDINSKTYAIDAGKRAVQSHIERCGMRATVESSRAFPTIFKLSYELKEKPLISIIIPNKDNTDMLMKCITSILNKSTYPDFEILVVENNSEEEKTFACYKELQADSHIRVIRYEKKGFNYSAINNYAVGYAKGSQLLFLNNDVEIITPNWMEEMLMYSQREDVAAVGAKLYYANNTIQHAGIIIGMGPDRCAGVPHCQVPKESVGYMGRLCYAQDFSAVTAACLMVAKDIFEEVGGFDEELAVAYNDVDLCLQFRRRGYLNVWTPCAEAYHYESVSRGYDTEERNRARFQREARLLRERWRDYLEMGDPYYNANLTLDDAGFLVKG